MAEALRDALERAGFAVDVAPDVATARTLARDVRHDLTLLDVGLPDGSGLELLGEWRRGARGR